MRASDLRLRGSGLAKVVLQGLGWGLAFALHAGTVHAEGKKDQDQAVRRLRLQLQQLAQEQSSSQEQLQKAAQDKAAVLADLQRAQSELGQAKSGTAAATRRAASQARQLEEAQQARDALQRQLAQTQEQLTQANQALRKAQDHGTELDQSLSASTARAQQQDQRLATCAANNVALYQTGIDLLSRYQNKGMGEVLQSQEPFLQTKRVTLENLVQDYRDKLDKAHGGTAASIAPTP